MMPVVQSSEDIEVKIGEIRYLLLPCDVASNELVRDLQKQACLEVEAPATQSLTPVLVIALSLRTTVSVDFLERFRIDRLQEDDVFQPAFFDTVVFYGASEEEANVDKEAMTLLRTWGARHIAFSVPNAGAVTLPSGPYIVGRRKVREPWRIYLDEQSAFVMSLKPQSRLGEV